MKKIYVILIFLFSISKLFAQLSPGDLHKSHAFLEGVKNCTKCHTQGNKLNPDNCLNCHTILKERIESGAGLHANKEYKNCTACHVDHLGRDYKLIYWGKQGKDKFDHDKTGYKLEGAHAGLKCTQCHNDQHIKATELFRKNNKDLDYTFLGLDKNCISCHHDEHRGQLKGDCLTCHTMSKWKETRFDHNQTQFVLTGKHKRVQCNKCHQSVKDNKYPDDASYLRFAQQKFNTCLDCHNDVHKNRFGSNCTKCHNTSGWSNYNSNTFNHSKTLYPLTGKHALLRCEQCHKPNQPIKIVNYRHCLDCHSDFHNGQFKHRVKKGACEECHTVEGFSPSDFSLEMHQECAYPLKGGHLAVPCLECHKTQTSAIHSRYIPFKFNNTRCENCHRDAHNGETNNTSGAAGCEFCHSVDSWHKVTFNHDKTRFKLEGRHIQVNCSSCHKNAGSDLKVSWHFKNVSMNCIDCHNDSHAGQFSKAERKTDCSKCHTPVDWFAERFDHERDSQFSLKGAHENVPCNRCHKKQENNGNKITMYKPVDRRCESCHSNRKAG